MIGFNADIEVVIARADLSRKASSEILAILKDASGEIPLYRLLKLLNFMENLKTGQLLNLASKRKPILENFFELLMRNDRVVSQICYLFFEQAYPKKRARYQLPVEMVRKLTKAGKMERSEGVKTIIWDLLWRQGGRLARLVSPEDLTFALWLNDPITRGKLIMFMFQHFDGERVMEAICKDTSKAGKKIPSNISCQFIGLAQAGTEFNHKSRLLSSIIERTELTHQEIERVWADYLQRRNRYELIEIFSPGSGDPGWIEDFARNRGQLSFDFKPGKDVESMTEPFASRVNAIRARKT
jgi:hypothetical protein